MQRQADPQNGGPMYEENSPVNVNGEMNGSSEKDANGEMDGNVETGLTVHRRFPRRWYLALVGGVLFLQGGGVLFGWPPTPALLKLIFPGTEPLPYESRDLIWAWAFLIVGAMLILWAGGRITARLAKSRPAVRAGPEGLFLSLRGPWRRPAAIPWEAVGGISAGSAADSRGEFPALLIEAVDPAPMPSRPWGARWTDEGVLSVDASDWRLSPEEAAERLTEIRDAAWQPRPSPDCPADPEPADAPSAVSANGSDADSAAADGDPEAAPE